MMLFRLSLVALLAVGVSAQSPKPPSPDALFAAIHRGVVKDAEGAVALGASADAVDADGIPAVMAAVLYGDADMVAMLLKHGADANRTGPAGTTALMWAAPDIGKIRLLLDHGANVNARSMSERTPLIVAASFPRSVDVVRLLLDRGADLRAKDRAGADALSLAV